MNSKRTTLALSAATLAFIGLLPLLFMFSASFRVNGEFGLKNYTDVLGTANTWTIFVNSLAMSGMTTLIAGLAGITLGILLARTDLPFSNYLAAAFAVPLLFPPYILAVGWFELLGRTGLLSRWIGEATAQVTSRWLFSLPGAAVVLASAYLPIVMLLTMTYLRGVNVALEEPARLSFGWPGVIRRLTIPLILPAILLSTILVFLLTMGEFGAPAFLRVRVFPVVSFTQSSAFYNFGAATAASVPLLMAVLAGLFGAEKALYDKRYSQRWGSGEAATKIPLGRKKNLFLVGAIALASVLVMAPLGGVLWRGSSPAILLDTIGRAGASMVRSIVYAVASATALSILGFFLGYVVERRALPGWRLLAASTLFLFTLPGTVIGLGMIAAWNRTLTNWIYATPAVLIFAFIAQYAALTTRIVAAGFSQVSTSLEEAAELAGAGWLRRAIEILAPVNRRAILAAWTITFLFCLRDVALPLLLAPPGGDTLTARTMTLMANGSPELIASLCVFSILAALLPIGAAGTVWRFWSKAV